jgi:hypothetical protein
MGSESWGEKIEGGFFDEAKHLYRDERGAVVPSATGVFDILGCSDFSMVDPEDLEWKRGYGSAVHKAIEYLVVGKLDWDTCPDEIIPAVVTIEQWLRQIGYEPVASEEKKIISFGGMLVGGTLDHRGSLLYKGVRRPAILDLKTGTKYSKTWDWQIGCYSGGAPKVSGAGYVGAAVQVKKNGKIDPHWVDGLKAQREFQILLAAAYLKLNAGLAKIKNVEEE